MKIKKAIKVYSLTVPNPNPQATISFFDSPSIQKLYFRSKEEAELYQQKFHPQLTLDPQVLIAVEDKDKQGNPRFVEIRKTENMKESDANKAREKNYYADIVTFYPGESLQQAIKENPCSVFVVKGNSFKSNNEDGPSSISITYECADTVTPETRFLYINDSERLYAHEGERWFIERGQELTMTDAYDLKLEHDLGENQQKIQALLAEQEKLREAQRQYGYRK